MDADWVRGIAATKPGRVGDTDGWWCLFCGQLVTPEGLPEEAHKPSCLWRAVYKRLRAAAGD